VNSTFGDLKSGEVEESKRTEVVAKIVGEVKAFGEGSEKGQSRLICLTRAWKRGREDRRG
jgi:hypothetical protein